MVTLFALFQPHSNSYRITAERYGQSFAHSPNMG